MAGGRGDDEATQAEKRSALKQAGKLRTQLIALIDSGKLPESLAVQRRMVNLLQDKCGEDDVESLIQELLLNELEVVSKVSGDKQADYLKARRQVDVGLASIASGDFDRGGSELSEAFTVMSGVVGENSTTPVYIRERLGIACASHGYAWKGKEHLVANLSACKSMAGDQHPRYAQSLSAAGGASSQTGEFKEAEGFLRDSLRIYRQSVGVEGLSYLEVQARLAWVDFRLGRLADAEALCRDAFATPRRTKPIRRLWEI